MTQTKNLMSKVQKKGQITIPNDLRAKYSIGEGDVVAFTETEDGILINRQEIISMKALDKIGEVLREQGIGLEELIEAGRETRGEIIKEKYDLTEER